MLLSIIVAASENNAIGRNNEMPWHLPNDLKFFKKTTQNHAVIMGRKSHESIGFALPKRLNIDISRNADYKPVNDKCVVCTSLDDAIQPAQEYGEDEIFIIGGGEIYRQAFPRAHRLYMTRVHDRFLDADTFFPVITSKNWRLEWEEKHEVDEKHAFPYTFQRWRQIM